jgi:DNA-binding GntR family transcriptional regulator
MHNAFMNPIEMPSLVLPSRGGLRHVVMREVLKDIFQGRLPAGTRLMVMKLAARFGTSSTPCREALVELEAVGVVEFIHNRGAEVAPFGPGELREIYQLRRILEVEATRCACGRIPAETVAAFRRELEELRDSPYDEQWSRREVHADLRLHVIIATPCGSPRLAKEIRRYDTLMQTIREIIGHERRAELRALQGHLAILDAMLLGDADATAAAMARHIENSAEEAEKAMFRRGMSPSVVLQ